MAKRSGMYKFEKRNKEIKRKKKQEEKRQKRLSKDAVAGSGPEIDYSLCTTADAAGVDLTELIKTEEEAAAAAAAAAAPEEDPEEEPEESEEEE